MSTADYSFGLDVPVMMMMLALTLLPARRSGFRGRKRPSPSSVQVHRGVTGTQKVGGTETINL